MSTTVLIRIIIGHYIIPQDLFILYAASTYEAYLKVLFIWIW